jgi:hypothetical protein
MSDDVSRRLDGAGHRPVPPPDPAFAATLEARLRAAVADMPTAAPGPVATPGRSRRPGLARWVAAAGFAVVVVAVLGLGLAGPDRAPRADLALEGMNVEVVLANGTVLEDPDGLLLPEGAVVRVGDGGFARIGETVLGPGDVATVGRAGDLEVVRPSPIGVIADPSPSGNPRPAATTGMPVASPSGQPRPTPMPSPVPEPTNTPTAPPEATRPPTATAATVATPRPTPTPTPTIVRPRLRAVLVDGPRIAVRWTETWSAARYVLVATVSRSGPAADPVYPGSRIIGEFAVPPSRAFRVRVPDGVVEVRLMVVALREDGRVLRRSRIVAVAIPASSDPMASSPAPTLTPTPAPTPTTDASPTPAP